MAINPAFVHSFSQSQQHAQSPPQTLSPYALHAPSPVETISPAAFYQQSTPSTSATPPSNAPTPTSNKLTPQARQEKFNSTIKSLLQPNQFTGAGAVSDLADKIIALDIAEIEGPLRLEILTKIRDNAGNHYFRAWVENEEAMDITREWLKAAAKGDEQLAETIMPLLHVRRSFTISMMDMPECRNHQIIDRLPWSLESLRKAKLGKIIVKLTKEASIPGKHLTVFSCLRNYDSAAAWSHLLSRLVVSVLSLISFAKRQMSLNLTILFSCSYRLAAVKDMASNLERKWRQMASNNSKDDAPKKGGDTETSEGGSCQFVVLLCPRD